MDYIQSLIKMIDRFNTGSVEEFKEIELGILADSKSIFKKNKDYSGHINKLKQAKKNAQRINPRSVKVPAEDEETRELLNTFQKCLVIFSGVCDVYIQFETALKNKAEGNKESVKYADVKSLREKMRLGKNTLNENLNEMNMWYADHYDIDSEDEDTDDLGGVKYMTYEALMRDDGEEK